MSECQRCWSLRAAGYGEQSKCEACLLAAAIERAEAAERERDEAKRMLERERRLRRKIEALVARMEEDCE